MYTDMFLKGPSRPSCYRIKDKRIKESSPRRRVAIINVASKRRRRHRREAGGMLCFCDDTCTTAHMDQQWQLTVSSFLTSAHCDNAESLPKDAKTRKYNSD